MSGSTMKSEPSDSYVPSNSRPHSSPLALSVGEPELPPVVSTVGEEVDRHRAELRIDVAGRRAWRAMAASSAFGASNSPEPVFFCHDAADGGLRRVARRRRAACSPGPCRR